MIIEQHFVQFEPYAYLKITKISNINLFKFLLVISSPLVVCSNTEPKLGNSLKAWHSQKKRHSSTLLGPKELTTIFDTPQKNLHKQPTSKPAKKRKESKGRKSTQNIYNKYIKI
jgi:hypothetical protein